MDNKTLLPDTLSFLEEDIVEVGLPKSVAAWPEFLPSLILGTFGVVRAAIRLTIEI